MVDCADDTMRQVGILKIGCVLASQRYVQRVGRIIQILRLGCPHNGRGNAFRPLPGQRNLLHFHAVFFRQRVLGYTFRGAFVQSCMVPALPKLIQPTQTLEMLMSVLPSFVYSMEPFLSQVQAA